MACKKVKYGSEELAWEYAQTLIDRGIIIRSVYYCEQHDAWHHSSMPKEFSDHYENFTKPNRRAKELPFAERFLVLKKWIEKEIDRKVEVALRGKSGLQKLPFHEYTRRYMIWKFNRSKDKLFRLIEDSDIKRG